MSKRFYLSIMEQLRKLLADNATALDLIDQLSKQINDGAEEIFQTKRSVDKDKFTLPAEVAGVNGALALFTDGACRGNPGPGAWAAMAQDSAGAILFESTSIEVKTTNNRMELEAVIQGLQLLCADHANGQVHVYSDSKYVVEGAGQWLAGWKRRGWLKSDNRPPENVELWKNLDAQLEAFKQVHWHWVKGHAGHPQNEYCDQLANKILNESGF